MEDDNNTCFFVYFLQWLSIVWSRQRNIEGREYCIQAVNSVFGIGGLEVADLG